MLRPLPLCLASLTVPFAGLLLLLRPPLVLVPAAAAAISSLSLQQAPACVPPSFWSALSTASLTAPIAPVQPSNSVILRPTQQSPAQFFPCGRHPPPPRDSQLTAPIPRTPPNDLNHPTPTVSPYGPRQSSSSSSSNSRRSRTAKSAESTVESAAHCSSSSPRKSGQSVEGPRQQNSTRFASVALITLLLRLLYIQPTVQALAAASALYDDRQGNWS